MDILITPNAVEEIKYNFMIMSAAFMRQIQFTWKTKNDESGKPAEGNIFYVGFATPEGILHSKYDNAYWDLFKVPSISKKPPTCGNDSNAAMNIIKKFYTRGNMKYTYEECASLNTYIDQILACMDSDSLRSAYLEMFNVRIL